MQEGSNHRETFMTVPLGVDSVRCPVRGNPPKSLLVDRWDDKLSPLQEHAGLMQGEQLDRVERVTSVAARGITMNAEFGNGDFPEAHPAGPNCSTPS
jgi:hypothetical protein